MYEKIDPNTISLPKTPAAFKPTLNNACTTVRNLDPSDFESFILEYLMFVNKSIDKNSLLEKTGGKDDFGIDIYFENGENTEYYQCKRYANPLQPNELVTICIKIISNEVSGLIKHPSKVHIVSSNGLSQKCLSLINDKEKLKKECLAKINKDDKTLLNLANTYNFDIFIHEKLENIVFEYINSEYCEFRFQSSKPIIINRIKPNIPLYDTLTYNKQLSTFLDKESIDTANINYYSALSLKYTIENLFGDSYEFESLKEEIYQSIIEINRTTTDKLDRYIKTIRNATSTNLNNVYVDYELHMVNVSDRKGLCHFLANEGKIKWN